MKPFNIYLCAGILTMSMLISTQSKGQQHIAPEVSIKHTKESAQQYGLIGEMPNGLVGSVKGAYKDAYIEQLIKHINKGRMIAYKAAARKKNLPIQYVQAKAADALYKSVGPGHYFYKNGHWQRR